MRSPSLNLSFFWHMHQPDYRRNDGMMSMPWVFLHAIKDYYDMPWLLSLYPGLKGTFNITPSLIEQLSLYREPLQNDYFLSLWERHPSMLDEHQKEWVIKLCKATQYETMVKKMERFEALFHRRKYSDADFIDLETVFLLAWCGNYLRRENDVVKELIDKKSGYTQLDKTRLLETLCAFIETILPFYASLQERGIISVSTTPYYHPIMPLLIDMENATRANEYTPLPERVFSLKEDALLHVERSIELYIKTFGKIPRGFWPAEGAVDEASLRIYKKYGIKWIATDEAVLFNSHPDLERKDLYQSYLYDGVTIGFRDHELSDLIGFTYRFKPPRDAAEHFIRMVEKIGTAQNDPTVFVIVDGENAWEFFEGNGFDFFSSLYTHLTNSSWCHTVTFDEVSHFPSRPLKNIIPGSWINGNFDTWVGHFQKNRAWELIYQTHRDVENFSGKISEEAVEKINDHFLKAECSDWFWWYGDDHPTEFGYEFDLLFRENLIAIYRFLEIPPPANLFEPIIVRRNLTPFWVKPQNAISPVIDGQYRSFFEWAGCGSINEQIIYSTMEGMRGPIEMILYGYDEKSLYLAFDGDFANRSELALVMIIEETGKQFTFPLEEPDSTEGIQIALDERLEIGISRIYFKSHTAVHLRFELIRGERVIQTMPGSGPLLVDLDENYAGNWFI